MTARRLREGEIVRKRSTVVSSFPGMWRVLQVSPNGHLVYVQKYGQPSQKAWVGAVLFEPIGSGY